MLKIELIAGYYKCAKCKYRCAPVFKDVSMSVQVGRTRYAVCQKRGQKSWQKKVLSKE